MADVIALPTNHQRSWRFLEPEYRKILRNGGVQERHIQPILDEMAGYFLESLSDVQEQETVSIVLDGLTAEQQDAVSAELDRAISDAKEVMRAAFMGAFGVILRLLVQKHQGHFNEGA